MRISFDLDGVIAKSTHWFFRMINILRVLNPDEMTLAEMDYYNICELKYHPNLFMAKNDTGIIVTARKSMAYEVTEHWLRRHGIDLPIYYADKDDSIDWASYEEGSKQAAIYKAMILRDHRIELHFDNNPILVNTLRAELPQVKIVLIDNNLEV